MRGNRFSFKRLYQVDISPLCIDREQRHPNNAGDRNTRQREQERERETKREIGDRERDRKTEGMRQREREAHIYICIYIYSLMLHYLEIRGVQISKGPSKVDFSKIVP